MDNTKNAYRSLIFFLGILCFCGSGCRNQGNEQEISRLEKQLDSMILQSIDTVTPNKIIHLVFFKTKNVGSRDSLVHALSQLKSIQSINELHVGRFKDLGDPRAMAAYDLVLYTSFSDSLAYRKYQSHELHLGLKDATKPFLAAPPVTYDYENE